MDEQFGFFGRGVIFRDFRFSRAQEDIIAVARPDGGGDFTDASDFDELAGILGHAREVFRYGESGEGGGRGNGQSEGLGALREAFASGLIGEKGFVEAADFLGQQARARRGFPVAQGESLDFSELGQT